MGDVDTLADLVCRETSRIVREGISRVKSCAHHRVSCEGWLKVELLHAMTAACHETNRCVRVEFCMDGRDTIEVVDPATGASMPTQFRGSRGQRADLAVHAPESGTVLVQLKTFPTNYGSGGKPITNFIKGVGADLQMLAKTRKPDDLGLALWMAYPIPEGQRQWETHLEKVSADSVRLRYSEAFELGSAGMARLYVMESR